MKLKDKDANYKNKRKPKMMLRKCRQMNMMMDGTRRISRNNNEGGYLVNMYAAGG